MRYVVLDLEMCKCCKQIPDGHKLNNEIIEIGAVLMDERGEIIDIFDSYVSPEFGLIDDYITNLTGITNGRVKNAPAFEEVIVDFMNWVPDDSTMVAWSSADKVQLKREATAKHQSTERLMEFIEKSIDCQRLFSEKISTNKIYRLEDALFMADIDQSGRLHNGFDDAYNTALLFAKLLREETVSLNPFYLNSIDEKRQNLSYSLGNVLGRLMTQFAGNDAFEMA